MRKSILALAVLLWGAHAQAQAVDCSTLPGVVYAPGTSDVKPLLARVAPKLNTAASPVTIVYVSMSSCSAYDHFKASPAPAFPAEGTWWDGSAAAGMQEKTCTIPGGATADLAFSDITWQTCYAENIPATHKEFASVVQTFGFVVPYTATQKAITAQEAFLVLKYAGETGKQIAPWTDPNFIFVRTPAASTQRLIGKSAGVEGTMWSANIPMANRLAGSGNMLTAIAGQNNTPNADKTIGILSTQRYDENRGQMSMKMLAFQAYKQQCLGAVLPDKTATSFEKQNVRDGHYEIWGYLWTAAPVTAGQPTKPEVKTVVDTLATTIDDAAKAGAIPQCAMKVKRAGDGAALQKQTPAEPCHCAFEFAATGATSCTPCSAGSPCATGTCHFGYCEVP